MSAEADQAASPRRAVIARPQQRRLSASIDSEDARGAFADAEEILVSVETAGAAGAAYRFSAPRSVSLSEPIDVVTVEWR